MPLRQKSRRKKKETIMTGEMQKKLGEYYEIIDFAKDPLIHLFYSHLRAGLFAFQAENQDAEQAIMKYKYMLRLAEAWVGQKYGFDFTEFRKQLQEQEKDEAVRLVKEVEKVAELLEKGTRKVEIVLTLKKTPIYDWYYETKEEEDKAVDQMITEVVKKGKNDEESDTSADLNNSGT